MEEINKYIEHTILKPEASLFEVVKVCKEVLEYGFLGVCVNPSYVKTAKKFIKNQAKVICVVNFPLASNTIETTKFQVEQAIYDGADEIDTVLNIAAIKNKDYKKAQSDIEEIVSDDYILKVILGTDLLTKEEIITSSKIAAQAGADFVKTSTGFVKGGIGATVENVKIMYDTVKPFGLGVKASGGIKTYEQAKNLIDAGAQRLGTSSGVAIVKGQN